MSTTLKKYLNVLKFIASIKDAKLRNGVLKQYAHFDDFYTALWEIATNTISKNVPLNQAQKRRLKPYKRHILAFTKRNKNKKIRKKSVLQSGGFLPILVPLIASLLFK